MNDYLGGTKSTVKDLIENGVFVKICDVTMIMETTNKPKQYVGLDLD